VNKQAALKTSPAAAISQGPGSGERGRAPLPVRLPRDLHGYGPQSAGAVLIPNGRWGAAAGQPALYAVVAMGAVFTSTARAPLTPLASVVKMTGDFSRTLPVMLAVAIASTVSRGLSYGTICTTKLLRRGTDIDKTTPGILRTPTGTPGNRQTSNPPPSHRQGPPVTLPGCAGRRAAAAATNFSRGALPHAP
jgi:hypothetical protein